MIDLHNDALLALPEKKLLPYLAKAKRDGVTEIWLAVWTTELPNPLATIKRKQTILRKIKGDPTYPICHLHIEDAWFLTPDNLDTLIKIHPDSVGLTWNRANSLAGGAHSKQGLTPWGRQVILKLENAGIQIDTAHLNRQSFWQFTKITTRPLLCTHTAFAAVRRHPRNLTQRQIKAIIATGGLIGLCLVPKFLTKNTTSCGFHDIIKHIDYFKKHFGRQNLRLGTDFYGTATLPDGITDYADLVDIFDATVIGYSVLKQPLIAYLKGHPTASKRLLITGGMHAREWIGSLVLRAWQRHYRDLPSDVCIAYIPCCNPDGARLATQGLTPFFTKQAKFLHAINHAADFSLWKANARAVDLNVNFNIGWGQGINNVTTPAPANYIGPKPHSEPETRALLKFIDRFRPTVSLALHSKGEVIYYSRPVDAATAEKLGQITQYQPVLSQGSYGGLTDYLALVQGIPAFTIEVGADYLPHPLGAAHLPAIMDRVQNMLYYFFNGE